jgi:hypothetical protein
MPRPDIDGIKRRMQAHYVFPAAGPVVVEPRADYEALLDYCEQLERQLAVMREALRSITQADYDTYSIYVAHDMAVRASAALAAADKEAGE